MSRRKRMKRHEERVRRRGRRGKEIETEVKRNRIKQRKGRRRRKK